MTSICVEMWDDVECGIVTVVKFPSLRKGFHDNSTWNRI